MTIRRYCGEDIRHFIPDLAALRIRVFRDYPYLYDGSMEYETEYLKTYADSPHGMIAIAFEEDKVVGASTGMPLLDYREEIRQPFVECGYDLSKIFYFGESVLDHACRGKGTYRRFFNEREAHAASLDYDLTCFCAVQREKDDPRRPPDYHSLDRFWEKRGYQKHADMVAWLGWKELGEEEDSPKPLVFWTRPLRLNP